MPPTAVDIVNLTHRYGQREALSELSLTVAGGCMFGVLGPNGGGKTTLFRILSTLLLPEKGSGRIFGLDIRNEPQRIRRTVGIIFQDVALDDELTVRENLFTHAALHGLSKRQAQARIGELVKLLDLRGRENDRVGHLSGGLKRRVDLVRGLLHAPPLLLLDEPTAGLDPAARLAFWNIVERVRHHEGVTIMVATHAMDEADRCDRLVILDEGRTVALGTPDELKRAVGTETLWIEAEQPLELSRKIAAQFGVSARVIGARVQLSDRNAHELLSSLYELYADEIRSATVRRPTLEDVFMVHAGHALEANVDQGMVGVE